MEVLRGTILTHGPWCKAFEEEFGAFLGDEAHCLTVSSCMAALHLAYLHFGIGSVDEVIVPAQTHIATVHAVEWTGATPIFVDCDASTGNLTAELIAEAVTPRTKAISVVHFLGIPCAMPEIMTIANQHGLKVIEDCALALGSRYEGKHVGLFGDVGCFSFYPVKHITSGEGGMFVTRSQEVVAPVAKLRAFGVDRSHKERTIPGIYDVPTLGLNYRMSEIQAALGRTQLGRIGENLQRRESNFKALKNALSDIPDVSILDASDPNSRSSHYCLSIVMEGQLKGQRNQLVAHLNTAGIGTSVYYPHPVPRMYYYRKKYGYDDTRYVQAANISDNSLDLPVAPHVCEQDIEYLVEHFVKAIEEIRL